MQKGILTSVVLAVLSSGLHAADLRLWYTSPATVPEEAESGWSWQNSRAWTRALPIGNGRLGGMVFGGVPVERIQLNEISLWSGWQQDADNPDAPSYLPEIRRLLFAGRYAEAQALTYEKLACKGPGSGSGNGSKGPYGSYETLGDLRITFAGHARGPEYRRELDLATGIATVSYRSGDVTFRREAFASSPAQVMAVRLTSDKPQSISFSATLSRPECAEVGADGPRGLTMFGRLSGDKGLRYRARLRAVAQGGRVSVEGNELRVEGANAVTLVLSAATSYRSVDPDHVTEQRIEAAVGKGFPALRKAHVQDHQAFFARVDLELPQTEASRLPTDERLAALANGGSDPGMAALYFQYGRYLLLSSSRAGGLPANLQGLWAESIQTPWNGDYHHNINDQMNYWPAEVGNLAECHLPFLQFIAGLVEPGRKTARVQYGLDGWVVHTISNIWGFTSPGEHPSWGQFPAAGAWLCSHLWEHYRFDPDRRFLEWAYPVMKESARFYLGFLTEEPKNKWLVTAPSSSPENAFRTPDGQVASVCYGPTMDMSILRGLFGQCIAAARILERDNAFIAELETARKRLAPLQIGRDGRLQEWIEDFAEPEPGHRHMSHLFALHPGDEISVRATPELARAARLSLERRLASGGGHTGWSRAWIVNFWARLEDGDKALEHLTALFAKSTLPNLFDNHPPFQIDGNLGGAAGVAEMLLQSHAGDIHLLPALPAAWPSGYVRGLRARGGATVDIRWTDGKLTEARIAVRRPCALRVRYANRVIERQCRPGTPLALKSTDLR